jgi:hypothetical protein
MTVKPYENEGLDDLLKDALADDLPAEVEAGMRGRIDLFRAAKTGRVERAAPRTQLSPRIAWAILSVLMLVSGILLQGLGSRNTLADRITHIKAEIARAETARPPGLVPETRLIDRDAFPLIRRKSHERDS